MFILTILLACTGKNSNTDSAIYDTGSSSTSDELAPVCSEPVEVACVDDLILDLSLQEEVSEGLISEEVDGADFVTSIDATAGGYQNASNNPWIYIKFTNSGAEKVEISDEDALESMDWDMSLRRFIIRLNGGSSGPSCVGAAVFMDETYASLTSVPNQVPYGYDNFYTGDCTLINDSSGLPNSPQTVLGPWWEYPGCVATTGHPFILELADGQYIKFVVEEYYDEGQDNCNTGGSMGSGSANFQIRWTFMN